MSSYKFEKQYRLTGYDYSLPGEYFVTICIKDSLELFGKILSENVILSRIGRIVRKIWLEIPKHFKNVVLDRCIIMPDHLHGIIVITSRNLICRKQKETNVVPRRNLIHQIQKEITPNKHKNLMNQIPTKTINNNPMQVKRITLGRIIRWFKGKSSYEIHKMTEFKGQIWQSRFYDHVIQSEESLDEIREYIDLNPYNWMEDRNEILEE